MKHTLKLMLPVITVVMIVIFFAGNNKGNRISPPMLTAGNSSSVWTDISENEFTQKGSREINPVRYRTLKADMNQLSTKLQRAPMENSVHTDYIFELPMPYGGSSCGPDPWSWSDLTSRTGTAQPSMTPGMSRSAPHAVRCSTSPPDGASSRVRGGSSPCPNRDH